MDNCRIIFNGIAYETKTGVRLFEFLRERGFTSLICGGHGKCGKCRVICRGSLSSVTEREKEVLSEKEIKDGVRLACQTRITGDCEILTEKSGKVTIQTDGVMPEIDLSPLFKKYGIAADIGTTTVVLRLYDKNGVMLSQQSEINPQKAFGADVISRMEAANNGYGGKITEDVRNLLCDLIKKAADGANIAPSDIDGAVIAGNTVMLYFLTGTDTEPLTHTPFETKRLFGEKITAKEAGLDILMTDTPVYLPPCVSAFIGADTVCAVISSQIYESEKTALLTDIGTNGETVLKCKDSFYACSTSAGPAFEGACISMGSGGGEGAIDKVSVLPDGTLDAHVTGEVQPKGICGSGIVDAVASLLLTGAIDETGYMEEEKAVIRYPVVITQADIRAVQLAKSAICSGVKTLLSYANLSLDDICMLYIAGGFGSYLNVNNAGKIGLIPKELTDKTVILGNASLSGASALLLSADLIKTAETLAKEIKTVDLASSPLFAEEYIKNIMF